MVQRVASTLSLLAFAVCLLVGVLEARNSFLTTVSRALLAMAVTLVIGLLLGWMIQVMLAESLDEERKKLKERQPAPGSTDR
jgi:putative Mn2+ efflux pump MntP